MILGYNYKICESVWDLTFPQILFLIQVKELERGEIDKTTKEYQQTPKISTSQVPKGSVSDVIEPNVISLSPQSDSPTEIMNKMKALEAILEPHAKKRKEKEKKAKKEGK